MQKQVTLVKADEKGRVSIRGTKKGHQYLVTADRGGWWVMPAPQVRTPARAREVLVADTWEKLGPAPEIDYDAIGDGRHGADARPGIPTGEDLRVGWHTPERHRLG